MTQMALNRYVKPLGVLGVFIILCAVLNMLSALLHFYPLRSDGAMRLHSFVGEISEAMAFVFPNSLFFVFLGIVGDKQSITNILAFFLLFDIPLAYACGRGIENFREKHGLLISIGAYAAGSVALYVISFLVALRI
jgi:hypothetical protein